MVQTEKLSKRFSDGTLAIEQISFVLKSGQFVSLIGKSGSGKSTLLRLINGLITPSQGNVFIDGVDLTCSSKQKLREFRSGIGFIFQQHQLLPAYSVLTNVLMGRITKMSFLRSFSGFFLQKDIDICSELLREVGLEGLEKKRIDQLSVGQRQRVAIARALAQEPKLILADEPLSSLDPKLASDVLDSFYSLTQKRKITVLMSTHVLDFAKKHADQILALRQGHLYFNGSSKELTDSMVNEIYA